jgi:hypothetical protein
MLGCRFHNLIADAVIGGAARWRRLGLISHISSLAL